MALAFKASMFTFLCSILPLFFKYPRDRCPAVGINTYLVHCPFLWWPQHAFAEVEALLTPFYHEKNGSTVLRPCSGQSQGRNSKEKNTDVLSCLVQSHLVSLSTSAFLPATLTSPSLPPKQNLLVQWTGGSRKQGKQK